MSKNDLKEVLYPKMIEHLNLQSIGYYIKEGSNTLKLNKDSFIERQNLAQTTLEKDLQEKLSNDLTQSILPTIEQYVSIKEEIQFSLGMKAGAKLALLLTTDFEHDF